MTSVGVGFITWSLARQPALLDLALEHRPAAVMLSFGDPNLHDPPYTPIMDDARNTVKAACDKAGLAFLCSGADESLTLEERARYAIDEIGAKIVHAPNREIADAIRKEAGRTMPV